MSLPVRLSSRARSFLTNVSAAARRAVRWAIRPRPTAERHRAQVLDLVDDMRPIDLFGDRLSGCEPAKQAGLSLGPQADVVAVEIAVATHLPCSRLIPTRRNSGSTVRSNSRITGAIRRRVAPRAKLRTSILSSVATAA